ncbi:hypothetical protein BC833DRAFT_654189 [Globomyces pollinis-pini]|nr:hypothetical protein BC833DRAFT_654189 [Globomyces pollinis-pini]
MIHYDTSTYQIEYTTLWKQNARSNSRRLRICQSYFFQNAQEKDKLRNNVFTASRK